jgi:GTP cyclohydrolase I
METTAPEHFRQLLKLIGEDPNREGLVKTPERAAKALAFLTSGYQCDVQQIINGATFESQSDEMVVVKDIEFHSLCEHHMLPFSGRCHIAYIPSGRVLGLSKFARIVDMYARRLQIQENMTRSIAETILEATNAQGVGVVLEAKHLCMMMRGVEKQGSLMRTSVMLGTMRNSQAARNEFLTLIGQL